MCGIMGYVGGRQAAALLLDGLKRLEYRGYDSAGIAVFQAGDFKIGRSKGKLIELEKRISGQDFGGTLGIGHTRWATHGKPSDENAHPHRSEHVVAVHNGIIENHLELRGKLVEAGFSFQSETDTEIIPQLVELYLREKMTFEEAVRKTISELEGTFALALVCSSEPDKVITAKNASPLILGIGKNENFVASDIPALLSHTRNVVVLEDGEMAVLSKDSWRITDFKGKTVLRKPRHITWSRMMAEKEGFKHFMLKEIHEQPGAATDTLRGRVIEAENDIVLDGIEMSASEIERLDRIVLLACGTSWHAALVAKFWIEGLARIPVEVDLASEYRYRNPVVGDRMLCVPISQSGETADTLAAMEEAKRNGARILSICNVVDSSIARKSNDVLYTHAGPEIGVASTKAFTAQLTALAMLALYLAKGRKTLDKAAFKNHLHALVSLPALLEHAVKTAGETQEIANEFFQAKHFLYLGRGSSYPIALEGALKLKEISYIHAEGYAGGEIKHGPIALIDEHMPVVVLATGGPVYPKMVSNAEEVRARGGKIIAIVTKGEGKISKFAVAKVEIPAVHDFIRPIVEVVPLQLLAYQIADRRGTDIDQPRNLAKSVTVE